jgi:cysteine-rich repeat protein
VRPPGHCLEDDGSTLTVIADGSTCPEGVCVAGVCGPPRCGDGVTSGEEGCDGEPDCRADCTRCGDDVIDPGEACDDGSDNSDEGAGSCRSGCVLASCGDGVKDPGEGCDEGDGNSDADPNGCRLDCGRASCGDGVVDDGEACDDGDGNSDSLQNTCRTTCVLASCGDGVIDDAELCDEGVRNSDVQPDACRRTCVAARCGDGTRDVGEGCDDGVGNSDVAANGCRSTCVRARCGDDVVDSDEVCDGAPDCSLDCRKISDCGDGVTDAGEDCDDGNSNDFDGCDHCRTSRWLGELQNRLTPDGPEPTRTTLSPRSVFVQPTTGRMIIASGCRLLQFPSSRAGEDPSLKAMVPIAGSPTCRTFEEPIAADGDVAAGARFRSIASVVADVQQNIYFIEDGVPLVRRIGLDGRLTTVRGMEGEHVSGMTADERGRVWWVEGSAIFEKGVNDVVTRIAGSIQTSGSSGDGGPAISALFGRPNALAVTPDGSLLVGDQFKHLASRQVFE